MKNRHFVYLSLVTALSLQAADVNLDTITVEENIDTFTIEDVSGEELKSADLGEALSKKVPSVTISRRSGIANDIILRGQKRDNINVIIDGGKIYGGCPNRMDPPISHIITNNIDSLTVDEGPYDVENFGTLSGIVKVHTKAPKKGLSGEVNLNIGSFDYKKGSVTLQGGNDLVRMLFTFSKETSEQYKDGDGDRFNDQLKKAGAPMGNLYQKQYENMDAYTKKSFMGKLFFNIADNQELRLSYTANRSDDVLYPSSPMDAIKDDSDLYNVEYIVRNLSPYSKKLNILYYYSKVDHPMSNRYRNAVKKMPEMTNHMKSYIQGARVKNSFDLANDLLLTYGIDASKRIWKGAYYKNGKYIGPSLTNAVTKNGGIFISALKKFANNDLKAGLRYDSTDITNSGGYNEPSYTSVSGYVFNTFHFNENTDIFVGLGVSHRVPDGRELYFFKKGIVGTPDLDQTRNSEVDLGIKKNFENSSLKLKVFYSKLNNYIYFDMSRPKNRFVNIDAKIYGAELSGTVLASDVLSFDYGVIYQRGKKDEPLPGQTDTDLADITPIRGIFSANYDYDNKTSLSFEVIAQGKWTHYDEDNGEQEIDGFATANIKVQRELMKKLELTLGVDNIFNKTYAPSNTYNDLTLIVAGGKQKVKLNDPGRYMYMNLSYRF